MRVPEREEMACDPTSNPSLRKKLRLASPIKEPALCREEVDEIPSKEDIQIPLRVEVEPGWNQAGRSTELEVRERGNRRM